MTNLLIFTVGAVLLVAATLALILSPFRRSGQARAARADIDRKQLNAAIYRDELAELESDLAEGSLSQTDYDQAYAELQRRLLEDSAEDAPAPAVASAGRKLPLALGMVLPVAAALLYLLIGTPAALNPPPQQQQFTADDIDRMVASLAAKLEKEPDNLQGWVMLARSYKAMGRLPEAVRAYERGGPLLEGNADLLLDYADTLAASIGGFDDKVRTLIDQALTLDPKHPQGLWLRGTAAYDAKRYSAAIADWESLLALLPPDSEDAGVLQANIAEVRELQAKAKVGAGRTAAVPGAFLKGRVAVAPALTGRIPAGAVLMVVARPTDGSRMPVAVARLPLGQFPMAFTLDDRSVLSPDRPLAKFPELLVEARISASGQAMPQAGDLYGPAQTAKLGAVKIALEIDQVRQ